MNSSYAGLTRVSIDLRNSHSKRMDCRVKPGNDEKIYVLDRPVLGGDRGGIGADDFG